LKLEQIEPPFSGPPLTTSFTQTRFPSFKAWGKPSLSEPRSLKYVFWRFVNVGSFLSIFLICW
jgi:hypothetical protein